MILDDLLKNELNLSAKKRQRLLKTHHVTCDGEIVTDKMLAIDPALFIIEVDGKRIGEDSGHKYIALNKPAGILSAKRDDVFKTVLDLLEGEDFDESLAIVGRLDRDSTGLVFLTNNGQLHYVFEQERFSKTKTYEVKVNGWIDAETVQQFSNGLLLEDGTQLKPAKLEITLQSENESVGLVTLTEGKRHQIKRMFLQCGVKVVGLDRLTIGPIQLDASTESGQYRQLYTHELLELKTILKSVRR